MILLVCRVQGTQRISHQATILTMYPAGIVRCLAEEGTCGSREASAAKRLEARCVVERSAATGGGICPDYG